MGGACSPFGSVNLKLGSMETLGLGPPSPLEGEEELPTSSHPPSPEYFQGRTGERSGICGSAQPVGAGEGVFVLLGLLPASLWVSECVCVSLRSRKMSVRMPVDVCLYGRVFLCVGVCVSFGVSTVCCWYTVRAYLCPHTPISRSVGV